jgi:ArsR family transcriptional regulator, cadmium/lead-responsive transcriptional repressor
MTADEQTIRTPDSGALARLGTALADATRRTILLRLLAGPAYPAELSAELGITRANTSNHLACLRGCGLVTATPEGRRMRYEVIDPALATRLTELVALLGPEDPQHDHLR